MRSWNAATPASATVARAVNQRAWTSGEPTTCEAISCEACESARNAMAGLVRALNWKHTGRPPERRSADSRPRAGNVARGGSRGSVVEALEASPSCGLRRSRQQPESLNAVVAIIHDVDITGAGGRHSRRAIELPVAAAERAPLAQVGAGTSELLNGIVAVDVRVSDVGD